jgi:peptide-methionine (R)-S-oxide reductase
MNRRYFLEGSTAIVGTAVLSRNLFSIFYGGDSKTMTTSKSQFAITKPEEEWRTILTPEQYRVLRKHGTEPAFSSSLDKQYQEGTFVCAGCGQALFTSDTKFNSGTGWPSFFQPIEGAIATTVDRSFFMTRIEVHCSNCGGHLGHVFDDGPAPTGKRYCMNGVAMNFVPA